MKNLLNLGKALNRAEQKNIFGGKVAIHKCGRLCTPSEHEPGRCRICDGNYRLKQSPPPHGIQ